MLLALSLEPHLRLLRFEVPKLYPLGPEEDLAPRVEPRLYQVFDDLVLAVEGDGLAGEGVQVDALPPPVELEVDAVVDGALLDHPVADADLFQELRRAVLQHAGPYLRLQVLAAPPLQHDRLYAPPVEQVREQEPRRSAAHYPYPREHVTPPPPASPCSWLLRRESAARQR